MTLIIRNVKTCALGPRRPFSHRVPAESGRRLVYDRSFAVLKNMFLKVYYETV